MSFCTVAQWGQDGLNGKGNPSLSLHAPDKNRDEMFLRRKICPEGDCVNVNYTLLSGDDFRTNLGLWHDWIIRVVWSPDDGGSFDVWHRLEGDSSFGEPLKSDSGVPTMNMNGQSAPPVRSKIGLYRAPHPVTHIMFHDSYCIAEPRAAAESCFS